MNKIYYSEQVLERIARHVITTYDSRLYFSDPTAIPIEEIIEAQGLVLEYGGLELSERMEVTAR